MLDGVTLAVNVPVDVEGTFDASGVLVATSVQATPDRREPRSRTG